MKRLISFLVALVIATSSFGVSYGNGNPRTDIQKKYLWKTGDIFKSDKAWEEERIKLSEEVKKAVNFKGQISKSPESMYQTLSQMEVIEKRLDTLYSYASLKKDEDSSISKYQQMVDRADSLNTSYSQNTSFFGEEVKNMGKEKVESFIASNQKLLPYRHLLLDYFRGSEHILSQREEELMSMASEATENPDSVFEMFNYLDIQNSNEENPYMIYGNTLAANYAGQVKSNIFNARARHFNSPLEVRMEADNIPISVYDNLISTVNKNLKPSWDAVDLKRKHLKIEGKATAEDLWQPLLKDYEEKQLKYEDALKIANKALKPLGNKYLRDFNNGIKAGWVEVMPSDYKAQGAYTLRVHGVHPYVLLNYSEDVYGMGTLVHEMGHAMNDYYSSNKQSYYNSNYSIFTAEVASTVNEILLYDYLIENTSDLKDRAYYIQKYMEAIDGSFYLQALYGEFEKTVHEKAWEGQPVDRELLDTTMTKLLKKYYGKNYKVGEAEATQSWGSISHFFDSFYVYQYSTGFSMALEIAKKLETEPDFQAKYLEFLSKGGSEYPMDLMAELGIDPSKEDLIAAVPKRYKDLQIKMDKTLKEERESRPWWKKLWD